MCGILAFLPVSCSDDSPVTGSPLLPEAPEGKVNVFLSLHKGSAYESPATRSGTAADETIMGPPWVLVFLGNDIISFSGSTAPKSRRQFRTVCSSGIQHMYQLPREL